MKKIVSVTSVVSALLLSSNVNAAENNSVEKRLNELEKEISQLKKENEKVKSDVQSIDKSKSGYALLPSVQNFKFMGRIHIDTRFYDEKDGGTNKDDQNDGIHLKRLRFGISGDLNDYISFYFEENFNDNTATVGEAWVNYKFNKHLNFKLGQVTEPFTHEQLMSSNTMPMIDYAFGTKFQDWYTSGLMMETNYKNASLHAGVFGESTSESGNRKDDSKYAFIGRAAFAPLVSDNSVIHMGASVKYKKDGNRTDDASTTSALENIDTIYSYAGELGFKYKSGQLFGEYVYAERNYADTTNANTLDYDGAEFTTSGFYVMYSQFLTGEQRSYSTKDGLFGGAKVKNPFKKGGLGAFEATARYTRLDLNDYDSQKNQEFAYGVTDEYTAGLNWYLYDNVRFMFNYSKVMVNDDEHQNNGIEDYEYDKYVLRSQINF